MLGALAEKKLMVAMADAARADCPYRREEIEGIVRATAIDLGLTVARTGNPYTEVTDVSTLVAGFLRRCADANVFWLEKGGRKLGLQRHINQNYHALQQYAAMVNPLLLAFQMEHGIKILPAEVGNWDECGLDLCAFASTGLFLIMKCFGNDVVVPWEQSPHMTLCVGFKGTKRFVILAIMKGTNSEAPSPFHAQLLDALDDVRLGQTETGWISDALKHAYAMMQSEAGIIDGKPCVINVDGHDSNVNNPALAAWAKEHNVFLAVPPSHTSAARGGMGTQQCDRPAHQGGPIARLKASIRRKLQKQFFAAVRDVTAQSKVSIAEILKIVALSWRESFDPTKIARLNEDVGYFSNEEGYLQWDLTRLLPQPPQDAAEASAAAPEASAAAPEASAAASAPRAPAIPRAFGRAAVQACQASQIAAVESTRRELDAVFALNRAIKSAAEPVVPRPAQAINRSAAARKHSRFGLVVGSAEYDAAIETVASAAAEAVAKRSATTGKFWGNHRDGVRAAEAALLANGGEPDSLGVGLLKSLIVSRTGGLAKAANNKTGEILAEARAALLAQATSLMPSDESQPPLELSAPACFECDCGAKFAVLPAPDENGMYWCTCGASIDV